MMTRVVFLCLGWLFVAIGIVGAVTPLLPTTVFLILAAGCFARSSPRLEAWLLKHRRFGPALKGWRESGAISRSSKTMACFGMALGFAMFWFTVEPTPLPAIGVAVLLLGCAGYVVSRPTLMRPVPQPRHFDGS
jgi:uncharacterized membrane protein YbaN (DUF454 family)